MLTTFNIVNSEAILEPDLMYFMSLKRDAKVAIAQKELDVAGAMAICEYLDCVDGGDVLPVMAVYRQGVAVLSQFLGQPENTDDAYSLSDKSWAAKTLLDLVTTLLDTSTRPNTLKACTTAYRLA